MLNYADNQSILQAILGPGATAQPTLLNTGVGMEGQNQPPNLGGQMPQLGGSQGPGGSPGPLGQNPGYQNTMQRFFSGPQSTFMNPMQARGTGRQPGTNSWSSGMGLDHQAILNNINLGGQQNG